MIPADAAPILSMLALVALVALALLFSAAWPWLREWALRRWMIWRVQQVIRKRVAAKAVCTHQASHEAPTTVAGHTRII